MSLFKHKINKLVLNCLNTTAVRYTVCECFMVNEPTEMLQNYFKYNICTLHFVRGEECFTFSSKLEIIWKYLEIGQQQHTVNIRLPFRGLAQTLEISYRGISQVVDL